MKNNIIKIKASYIENTLRIGIHTPDSNPYFDDKNNVEFNKIEKISRELVQKINKPAKTKTEIKLRLKELKKAGTRLCDLILFSNKLKDKLNINENLHLKLEIDDRLVQIPWELLVIGDKFLCQRFSMGRSVDVSLDSGKITKRNLSKPIKIWLLADTQSNLDWVEKEVNDLEKILTNNKNINLSVDTGDFSPITPEELQDRLKEYDFVIFAGHAEHNNENQEKSGWKLLNDKYFSPAHIKEMTGSAPMPAFIFANACQSACTEKWSLMDDAFDMAHAFRLSGVEHYLGTFWNVLDKSCSKFSVEFYKKLLSGYSIGESVRLARQSLLDSDITWASYTLYGDPTVRYFDCDIFDEDTSPIIENNDPGDLDEAITEKGYRFLSAKTKSILSKTGKIIVSLFLILACFYSSKTIIKYFKEEQEFRKKEFLSKQNRLIETKLDQLIQDIKEITGKSPFKSTKYEEYNDGWSSKPSSIAIIYDAKNKIENRDLEDLISLQLEKLILNNTRIKVVCRMPHEFIQVIKESINRISIESIKDLSDARYIPELTSANLILYVSLINFKTSSFFISSENNIIGMRLVDCEKGILIEAFTEHFNKDDFFNNKKESFSKNVLSFLNKEYPLQGKVSFINQKKIDINIGYESGVKPNQLFKATNYDVIFKALIASSLSSTVTIVEGKAKPEKDWQVECIQ